MDDTDHDHKKAVLTPVQFLIELNYKNIGIHSCVAW